MKLILVAAAIPALLGMLGCSRDDSDDTRAATISPTATSDTERQEPMEVDLGTGPALIWGSGSYGVILVHGAIYDAASWTDQAEAIANKGFAVVAVERATADDTRAAMDYLRRELDVANVALIGASAGTGPVLSVASEPVEDAPPAVDLVVVLAGSGNVENLAVPSVLFIAAEGDGGAATAAERMMNESSGDPADLLIIDGSAHAQALFNEPEGDIVLDAILERLTMRQSTVVREP